MMDFDVYDEMLDENVLKNCERKFYAEANNGVLTPNTEFDYASCLIYSKFFADIGKAVRMFKNVYKQYGTIERKKSCLYFMALGHAKLKEYKDSLKQIKIYQKMEPNNRQVKDLEVTVRKCLSSKRIKKVGIAAGAASAVVAIGLGLAYLFTNIQSNESDEEN